MVNGKKHMIHVVDCGVAAFLAFFPTPLVGGPSRGVLCPLWPWVYISVFRPYGACGQTAMAC